MSLVNLFVGSGKKLKIGSMDVQVSVSESHEFTADVTDNPVESGANVTDHVQIKPVTLSIQGLISDTPINFFYNGGSNLASGLIGSDNNTASLRAYDELQKIFKARQPIAITTGLASYENMIMTSLSIPVDNQTGKALRFTASFKEVRIVSTVEAAIPAKAQKKTGITSSKKDMGKKTATPPGATSSGATTGATDNGSILSKLIGLRG